MDLVGLDQAALYVLLSGIGDSVLVSLWKLLLNGDQRYRKPQAPARSSK